MIQSDASTFDLGQSRLKLKEGLKFSLQQSRNSSWYLVQDVTSGIFFRVGVAEYVFMTMLDGDTTMSNAMATTCSTIGADALNEHEAIQLCNWLAQSGLAHTRESILTEKLAEKQKDQESQKKLQRLNPVSIQIPLIELDRFAETAHRYCGWLIHWAFALIACLICGFAAFSLISLTEWPSQIALFNRNNFLWMAITWCVLKFIHELAHIVTCKHYGGFVGRGGILLLLLIPMPFVDVTSAWSFRRRKHRIIVSAAGMLAEIFIAAIAAIVWVNADAGLIKHHCFNIMIAASIHTLLFNANPLMKFDGYHMLADCLEIQNLGTHGQKYVRGIFKWIFFGTKRQEVAFGGFHGHVVRLYGFAALIWKVLLCGVLAIAGANLFEGIGLVVALLAGVLWLGLPLIKFLKYLVVGAEFEQPNRLHFALATAALLIGSYSIGRIVPAPSAIVAPVVVDYEDQGEIRATAPGFVASVEVEALQEVEAGQLLVRLENRELVLKQKRLEVELRQAELLSRQYQAEGNIPGYQAEIKRLESLQKQLAEASADVNDLELRASTAGVVSDLAPGELVGTFVSEGALMMSINDQTAKKVTALFTQENGADVREYVGRTASIRLDGTGQVEVVCVERVDDIANDSLPHFAFAGKYGGVKDVVVRDQMEDSEPGEEELMLLKPCFEVELSLDEEASLRLIPGQTGILHVRARNDSLGNYLVSHVGSWVRKQITSFHGL